MVNCICEIKKGSNIISEILQHFQPELMSYGWSDFESDEERHEATSYIRNLISFSIEGFGEYDSLLSSGLEKPSDWSDDDTTYKGNNLHSAAHKRICALLESKKIKFYFESMAIIPDDVKSYRRIDLTIIKNNRACIVEIDGAAHRSQKQQQDDYERDRLITNHWNNTLRLEYGWVKEDFIFNNGDGVLDKILSRLDGKSGSII